MYLIRLDDEVELVVERYEFLSRHHLWVHEPGQPDYVLNLSLYDDWSITEVESDHSY